MDQLAKLQGDLAKETEHFDKESTKHKNMYRQLRILAFGLAASSTVLAGLAAACSQYQVEINLAIVVITALIGLITSVEGIRKPAELWIHERNTYYALKDLEREVEFMACDGLNKKAVCEYFQRMQTLLGAAGEKWNRHVQPGAATQSSVPGQAPGSGGQPAAPANPGPGTPAQPPRAEPP